MYNFIWAIDRSTCKPAQINEVLWATTAFKAGISAGATVVAVNGKDYSCEVLSDVITAAKGSKTPISLSLKYRGSYQTIPVDSHDGLQYSRLQHSKDRLDHLSQAIP